MLYADYNYYTNEYIGELSDETFKAQILKASKIIDRNINTVLDEIKISKLSKKAQDELKYTACAIVDLLEHKNKSDNTKLSSLSIDGVSKTFKSISTEEYKVSLKNALEFLPDELTRYL